MTDEAVVAIFWPFDADVDELAARLGPTKRPVRFVATPYAEDHELRAAKSRVDGPVDLDRLRALEAPLTDSTRAALAEAEVLVALDAPIDVGDLAPNLRWVQAGGAGITQLRPAALAERGITLTTAAGVSSDAIADFVLARLLHVWKDLSTFDQLQARHQWRMTPLRPLAGLTVVVVGLGAIGTAVADRCPPFGLRVVGVRRDPAQGSPPSVEAVYGPAEFGRLLPEADAVVLAAPATADTTDLIDAQALAAMKPDAILVNVGRGSLVDEQALRAALVDGRLGAAILDVTRVEPLPADDPLWDTPRLYLSPHSSAVSDDYGSRLLDHALANLRRYLAGEPLANVVDPARGY